MWLVILVAVVVPALGALLGTWTDAGASGAVVGAAVGGGLVAASVYLLTRSRLSELADWLRLDASQRADRMEPAVAPHALRGLWAELGERIHRSLQLREREIERQQAMHQQFLEAIQASPNGVLLLDPQGRIEWCNATAAAHFGLDPRRDRLQHVQHLIRDPLFVSFLQAAEPPEGGCVLNRSGVGMVAVQMHAYGDGRRLMLSHDVTERERADRMRQDFVANVSHEIRTPLTVLSGFVETLATIPVPEADRQHYLGLMRQQTQRMQTLVADLLTLARLEGASPPPADQWVAVSTLQAQAELEAQALSHGRHDIRFRFDQPHGGVTEIAGNEAELLSLLSNLISNAIRHTPDDGLVEVSWQPHDAGHWALAVRDSGVGIAPEHLPRLTERFYRVDRSRSRETGGTGLGLAIVKHVLLRHGGELQIDSAPGQGSTFRALLPTARVRVRPANAEAAAAAAQGALTR
jgi:two-component system phosphate regulon sensor histidine kinase PhoR